MMKRLILSACAGLFAATTAVPSLAADLPRRPYYKAPVYTAPPAFTRNGLYVGVNGGYGWATSNWSSAATSGDPKLKGWLIGGTVGYNMQTGVWVWGLEVDADVSTIKGSTGGGSGVCSAPAAKPAIAGSAAGACALAMPETGCCRSSPAGPLSATSR